STVVSPPGSSSLSRGVAATVSLRVVGGIERLIAPEANAGRLGNFGSGLPSSSGRDEAPTRSTWTWMFGRDSCLIGIFNVCDAEFIVNRSLVTRPERRSVSTPSAGKNGD